MRDNLSHWMVCCLTLLGLLFISLFASADDGNNIQIDSPRSGWQVNAADDANFSQPVNYPASSVNLLDGQSSSANISGQIKGLPKGENKPGMLIVNGVSMPLSIDESGRFARPYIFPDGSNSIEVHSPDGSKVKRQQFYAAHSAGSIPAKLRIVLSWDTDNTDLDLHVVTPDGQHAWYGNRELENGGALDIDVTTGYGPEIYATPTPLKGAYLVYVNYYGGEGSSILTVAKLTIVTAEGTANEKQEEFIIPMRNPGELTLVKKFNY